ncbi:hypothetical protein EWM64_g6490 [Hericium alpestre]|uniref:Uncharacterized protein n=1 Tax=Hericium alpestre TaxID=135208 RepID=A0A4Y9ZRV8_9AGAM|nr:hypothetical protein EWM64_g6490 [Hericium alpestre]
MAQNQNPAAAPLQPALTVMATRVNEHFHIWKLNSTPRMLRLGDMILVHDSNGRDVLYGQIIQFVGSAMAYPEVIVNGEIEASLILRWTQIEMPVNMAEAFHLLELVEDSLWRLEEGEIIDPDLFPNDAD